MPNRNSMCDGSHCKVVNGEVRLLPYGGGGNMIYCRACYEHEMSYRRERNRDMGYQAFELPKWEDLKVYTVGE